MRFINQIFVAGKAGLTPIRKKAAADDGNAAESIFVQPEFWSASEFNFPYYNATRVPAAGNP
jgi:hypothetical protein